MPGTDGPGATDGALAAGVERTEGFSKDADCTNDCNTLVATWSTIGSPCALVRCDEVDEEGAGTDGVDTAVDEV